MKICTMAILEWLSKEVKFLLQVLHPQSMRPAREGEIPVRVKNSYNPKAPGTIITKTRDMTKVYSLQICVSFNGNLHQKPKFSLSYYRQF